MRSLPLVCAAALCLAAAPLATAQGTLAGTVVDGTSGETLIGANVFVTELGTGASTNLDGAYRLTRLPAGTYSVRYSFAGLDAQTVTGVQVADGETTTLDVTLTAGDFGEIVVEVEALRNNEAALLRDRQNAAAVSDAISAEAISRSGASTASDALGKVTGASVVGGRYVVMRGLQGRYLNVQLNSATLPSADPDNNSVPLDLFPSGLLDNIVTTKTFTADKPGDFTGGSVNLSTRDFPTQLTGGLSFSTGFASTARPGTDVLAVPGARLGLLGAPETDPALPALLDGEVPELSLVRRDADGAERLSAMSEAFSPAFVPTSRSAPLDQGMSFSIGNQIDLAGRPLGFIAGVNWSRSVDGFTGGISQSFKGLTDSSGEVLELGRVFGATDESGLRGAEAGSEEVLLGGLANLSFRPTDRSEIGLNLIANRSSEAEAYREEGRFFNGSGSLDEETVREGRSLLFQDRSLASAQLRGDHALSASGFRVEWNASAARTTQDEPDYRIFFSDYTPRADGSRAYALTPSSYTQPTRYFRDLGENAYTGNLDVTLPVALVAGADRIKVGGTLQHRDRTFRERRFLFLQDDIVYDGDAEAFFAPENVGITAVEGGRYRFGNYVANATSPQADYDGAQTVGAGYAMTTLHLGERLRAIAGVRVEATAIAVEPVNVDGFDASLDEVDVLPSLNLVYGLSDAVNLRAAYGRTLARPTFRELAPYAAYELRTNRTFVGNPELTRSLIDNVDVRAEWFVRPGEIVAVSGYLKRFANPIELTYNVQSVNAEVQPRNLSGATVYGVEIEARRRLDGLPGPLANLSVGGNLTLTQSSVEILASERERRLDPAETTRPLQGQSPYVVNLDLGYESLATGTSVGLFYNLFGSRLHFVSVGNTPDVYEAARGTLDLTARQSLGGGISLKASAKNLTDQRYELVQTFRGESFLTEAYDRGRSVSVGVSYGF